MQWFDSYGGKCISWLNISLYTHFLFEYSTVNVLHYSICNKDDIQLIYKSSEMLVEVIFYFRNAASEADFALNIIFKEQKLKTHVERDP